MTPPLGFVLVLICLLGVINVVKSADDFCGPSTGKIIQGQRTYVCIVIADLEDWNGSTETGDVMYHRFMFRPIVDDFAKMEVKDCECRLWAKRGEERRLG
jgi:hypothetical protein